MLDVEVVERLVEQEHIEPREVFGSITQLVAKSLLNVEVGDEEVFYRLLDTWTEYNKGICDGFDWMMPRLKDAKLVGEDTFKNEDASIAAQITRIKSLPQEPDAIMLCSMMPGVVSAIKQIQQKLGQVHVNADIGCHTFGTLPPFNVGSTELGDGLGLASSSGVGPLLPNRNLSAGVDVGMPVYAGGSIKNSVRAAETRVEAGQAELARTFSQSDNY